MSDLFSAYEVYVKDSKIPAYIIESTAPDNIDDNVNNLDTVRTTQIQKIVEKVGDITVNKVNADKLIANIVDHLRISDNPSLVISIHGFNNPFHVIIEGFLLTFKGVINDHEINNHDVVCIGYRWPSEQIFAPVRTALRAAPNFLIGLFFVPVLVLLAVYLLSLLDSRSLSISLWQFRSRHLFCESLFIFEMVTEHRRTAFRI